MMGKLLGSASYHG